MLQPYCHHVSMVLESFVDKKDICLAVMSGHIKYKRIEYVGTR